MTTLTRRLAWSRPTPGLPFELTASTALAGLVGITALLAVALGIPRLTSVIPSHVPVAANTGLCFILLAVALRGAYYGRRYAMIPAAIVLGIAVITLLQFVTGRVIGIDRWLLGAPPGASEMSPQTAIALALLSAGILTTNERIGTAVIRIAAGAILLLAAVNLLDVIYDASQPTVLAGYTQMALPTAVTFLALAVGITALRPDGSLLELLRHRGAAGALARRLLGAAIIIPVGVGWLRLAGERAGWYESAFGVTLVALTSIVLFTSAVWLTARTIHRSEAARERAEEERERARAEAEAANLAKSEFLSRMSHELRTPLNSVLGFAQLLEGEELAPEQRESVVYIRRAGRHLLELINEVVDIARIDTGSLTISVEAVSVAECLEEVISFVVPMAIEREISIDTAGVEECNRYVLADRQRLRQVLLNLLSNAVKYNRDGGSITVTCQEMAGGRLRINVTDTGLGISPTSYPRLFQPFDRLGVEATEIEGAGMGLALSRALVEAMGGEIGVESLPGTGSTFWVALPGARTPDHALLAPLPSAAPGAGFDAPRDVLYIEDNPANLRLVERIFERMPRVRLTTASRGQVGLTHAQQHPPALVLLDLHLPDMDGGEVLRQLRAHAATADVPVVILTVDGSARQTDALMAAGADAYLTKPLDVKELVDVVERKLVAGAGVVA